MRPMTAWCLPCWRLWMFCGVACFLALAVGCKSPAGGNGKAGGAGDQHADGPRAVDGSPSTTGKNPGSSTDERSGQPVGAGAHPKLPERQWTNMRDALADLQRYRPPIQRLRADVGVTTARSKPWDKYTCKLSLNAPDTLAVTASDSTEVLFELSMAGSQMSLKSDRVKVGSLIDLIKGNQPWDAMEPIGRHRYCALMVFLAGTHSPAADGRLVGQDAESFELSFSLSDELGSMRRRIDKATGVDRIVTFYDTDARQRLQLAMDDYQVINGLPWPMKITFSEPGTTDDVVMTFDVSEIEPAAGP